LDGQSHFAQGAGFQSRVVADSIEQIVEDRQASLTAVEVDVSCL
jgi:hypothetical protein